VKKENIGKLDDEVYGTLTAISIVSMRLAKNFLQLTEKHPRDANEVKCSKAKGANSARREKLNAT